MHAYCKIQSSFSILLHFIDKFRKFENLECIALPGKFSLEKKKKKVFFEKFAGRQQYHAILNL
jgi:hypothetical protein